MKLLTDTRASLIPGAGLPGLSVMWHNAFTLAFCHQPSAFSPYSMLESKSNPIWIHFASKTLLDTVLSVLPKLGYVTSSFSLSLLLIMQFPLLKKKERKKKAIRFAQLDSILKPRLLIAHGSIIIWMLADANHQGPCLSSLWNQCHISFYQNFTSP